MNNNWWRKSAELRQGQKTFLSLPIDGKYSLVGPPGSGKTNLLLLRAQYIAGSGNKNVLVVTFTKTLRNFIQSGIGGKGLISSEQIQTYHSWAAKHVMEHLQLEEKTKGIVFDDAARAKLLNNVVEANKKLPSLKVYDAIFVDEVQDLSIAELEALLCLSDKICVCGDSRQGIYKKDGIQISQKLGLQTYVLEQHFRIGQKIAKVADKIIPPAAGDLPLEGSSGYTVAEQGESSANLHFCKSRDEQFNKLIASLEIQLDAFIDDTIGILCGKRETLQELKNRFDQTEFAENVVYHGIDVSSTFVTSKKIHVMTMHGAKGTEFRAVHLYGIEELNTYPLNTSVLAYTAITRAKTALNAYCTEHTSPKIESAFADQAVVDLSDLF